MNTFIKIIRWIFYILVASCLILFIIYKNSNPANEEIYRYSLYCGFGALGLSFLRFILRFMY